MILQLTKRDWSVWESCALETSGFRICMEKKEEIWAEKLWALNKVFLFFKKKNLEKLIPNVINLFTELISTNNNGAYAH